MAACLEFNTNTDNLCVCGLCFDCHRDRDGCNVLQLVASWLTPVTVLLALRADGANVKTDTALLILLFTHA